MNSTYVFPPEAQEKMVNYKFMARRSPLPHTPQVLATPLWKVIAVLQRTYINVKNAVNIKLPV